MFKNKKKLDPIELKARKFAVENFSTSTPKKINTIAKFLSDEKKFDFRSKQLLRFEDGSTPLETIKKQEKYILSGDISDLY